MSGEAKRMLELRAKKRERMMKAQAKAAKKEEAAQAAELQLRTIMLYLDSRSKMIRDKLGAERKKQAPNQAYMRVLAEVYDSINRFRAEKDSQGAPPPDPEDRREWAQDLLTRAHREHKESYDRIRPFERSMSKAAGGPDSPAVRAQERMQKQMAASRAEEEARAIQQANEMYDRVYESYFKAYSEVAKMLQMAEALSESKDEKYAEYAEYARRFDLTLKKLDERSEEADTDREQEEPALVNWNQILNDHLGNIRKLLEEAKTWADESQLWSHYSSVMPHQENALQESQMGREHSSGEQQSPPSQGGAAVAHSQLVQAHPILRHRTTVELLLFKHSFCLRWPVTPPQVAKEALAVESIDYNGKPIDANDNKIGILVFVWLCRQFHCLKTTEDKTEAAEWLDQQLRLSDPQAQPADPANVVPEFFTESVASLQREGHYQRRNRTIPIDSTDLLMEMFAPRQLETADWTNCVETIGTRKDMLNACWKLLDARSHRILFSLLTREVAKKMGEKCEPNLAIFNAENHWAAFPPGVQAAILQALWNDLRQQQPAAKSCLDDDEREFLEAAIASPPHVISDPTEVGTSLAPAQRVVKLLKAKQRRTVSKKRKAAKWNAPATPFEYLNPETLFDAHSTPPEQREAVAMCLKSTLTVTALKHCIAELNTVLKDHQFFDFPMPTTKKTKADCIEYIVCRLFDTSISADHRVHIFKRLQLKVEQMNARPDAGSQSAPARPAAAVNTKRPKTGTGARFWDLAAQL